MTTPEPQSTPMPGRRFQFTLAGLLGLTTIVAVVLSLLKWVQATFGMDVVGIVILLAFVVSLHVGSAAWAIADAQKRRYSSLLVVSLFAYFGPLGALLWLLVRPRSKVGRRRLRRRRS
jgi:hypothetical protein